MRFGYFLSIAIPIILVALLTGCTIDEYDGPATGFLFVSAVDSSGNPLEGATITLDGTLRSEVTPDTLKNVTAGGHTLRIDKYGYLAYEDSAVMVQAYEVSSYQAALEVSPTGALSIAVTNGPATVIVNGQSLSMEAPAIFPEIPTGVRAISVFRAGYLTSPDSLIHVNIVWQDTADVSFDLTAATAGNQVENVAPDFTLQNDNLASVSLHNYRGRVVLVDFWYRDCYFCMLEFPDLEQVYQEYAHHGFQILAVDPYDPLETVIEVREDPSLNPTFQLLLDSEHQVEGMYNVTLYPTNFLIDGSGEIRYRIGHTTADELRSILNNIYGFTQ
jgi:peroxiredoxin